MGFKDFMIKRLLLTIPTLLGMMLILFTLSRVIPEDPARMWVGLKAKTIDPTLIDKIREKYYLNEPIYIQFFYYLRDLSHGDLGISPITNLPVAKELAAYLPNTAELAIAGIIISIAMGIPLGILAAIKKDKPPDHVTRIFALIGIATPGFWLALILQLIFYYNLGWLPEPGGMITNTIASKYPIQQITRLGILDALITGNWPALTDQLKHIILPAFSLSIGAVAVISRMVRSSVLEIMGSNYIRTARAGGLPERVVIYRHILRNALIPSTTVIGAMIAGMLSGAVIVESVYYWPGIGRYATQALFNFDFPAIMGFAIIMGIIYIFCNLIVDLLYGLLDPRIRVA